MRVLIFGDSIAQGFFDSKGGWANRIANDYHQKVLDSLNGDLPEVFNLGVSGDDIENLLDRIEDESEARRWKNGQLLIVVAIGINDSILKENRAVKDEYKFQEQYEKLVDIVQDFSEHCLFVGLSAVDENLTDPIASSTTGKQFLNNRINLFEDCIKQVCEQKNVPFVPVHDMFIGQLEAGESLLSDGLHPNEAGHQLIVEIVKPYLEKLLEKE
jgi:lysophospholipase L1-like esterase